ncbi:hypothetical protein ACRJ4B_15695 [Streptomyces sp. GTA36]
MKQTAAAGEVGDFLTARDSGRYAKGVDVSVLSVVGDHDTFSIDPADRDRTVAAEPAAYPASPRGDAKVIPDAGHDLALQLTVSAPREPMPDRQAGPWHSDVCPPHLPENQPVGDEPPSDAWRTATSHQSGER